MSINIPGYTDSTKFELQIGFNSRDDVEKIVFCADRFPIPTSSSVGVLEVPWGAGYRPIQQPGLPERTVDLQAEFTNFYDQNILQLLVEWHESSLIDIDNNRKEGWIVGKDDLDVIVYEAQVIGIWPAMITIGEYNREYQRQRISCRLIYYDVIHSFND